jgi:hypothetical protein
MKHPKRAAIISPEKHAAPKRAAPISMRYMLCHPGNAVKLAVQNGT